MKYARILMAIGIAIMVASQVLPLWTQRQMLTIFGPQSFTTNRTYGIDAQITPPIRSGSGIVVTLNSSKPGSAAVLVFPSSSKGDMRGPSVLADVLPAGERSAKWNLIAPEDSNYLIVVSSWNSTYSLMFESTWSPYYDSKTTLLVGFAVLLGGGLMEYYESVLLAERKKRRLPLTRSDRTWRKVPKRKKR